MRSLLEQKKDKLSRLAEQNKQNQIAFDAIVKGLHEEISEENQKHLDKLIVDSLLNLINVAATLHKNSKSDEDKWEIIYHLRATHTLLTNFNEKNLATYINSANKSTPFPQAAKLGGAMLGLGLAMIIAPIIAVCIVGLAANPLGMILGLVFGIGVGLFFTGFGSTLIHTAKETVKADPSTVAHAMQRLAKDTDSKVYEKATGLATSLVSFFGGNSQMVHESEMVKATPGGYNSF